MPSIRAKPSFKPETVMTDDRNNFLNSIVAEVKGCRHELHQNPATSYEEFFASKEHHVLGEELDEESLSLGDSLDSYEC